MPLQRTSLSGRSGRRTAALGLGRDSIQAAQAECCDFQGLGPHSFRRANITWRQQVGDSAIQASRIAGHSDLEITGEYTFVTPKRQNELTLRIQQKLAAASAFNSENYLDLKPIDGSAEELPTRIETEPVTSFVQ